MTELQRDDFEGFIAEVLQQVENTITEIDGSVTDHVFLAIQNNREFMQKYLRLVSDRSLDYVNQRIGRDVKSYFELDNFENDEREFAPQSFLIKSYQKLRR